MNLLSIDQSGTVTVTMAASGASRSVSASYLLSPLSCSIIGRLLSLAITVVIAVFVAYTSWAGTSPEDASSGGLSACFDQNCGNAWNWHVLLFTIAVAVAMTESYYAFTPILK